MKLSELKRICDEATDDEDPLYYITHEKYRKLISPSRVKKMIELLDRAQKIMIENEVVFAENWLKDFSEEFGE